MCQCPVNISHGERNYLAKHEKITKLKKKKPNETKESTAVKNTLWLLIAFDWFSFQEMRNMPVSAWVKKDFRNHWICQALSIDVRDR